MKKKREGATQTDRDDNTANVNHLEVDQVKSNTSTISKLGKYIGKFKNTSKHDINSEKDVPKDLAQVNGKTKTDLRKSQMSKKSKNSSVTFAPAATKRLSREKTKEPNRQSRDRPVMTQDSETSDNDYVPTRLELTRLV